MTTIDWILLVSAIIFVCLGAFAIKFPRGRGDWEKDRSETFFMVLSAGVFLMLFFLLWYVSAVVDWPDALAITFWASVITLVGLVIVSFFAPTGIKVSLGKKEQKAVEDDE